MSDKSSNNPFGGADIGKILNNPDIQEKLNAYIKNPAQMNFGQNIYNEYKEKQEKIIESFAVDDDCPNYTLCTNLNISVPSICTKGSDMRHMCSFGESRIIILLSRMIPNGE